MVGGVVVIFSLFVLFCFVLFCCCCCCCCFFFLLFSRFSTPEPNAQVHQYNLALSVVINFSHFRLLLWNGIQRILTGSKISTSSTKFVLIGPFEKNKMSAPASDWLAFDLIDRSKLWTKLVKHGIDGKMLQIIKSLYNNIKICIKHDGNYFSSYSGLLQGEICILYMSMISRWVSSKTDASQ